MFPSYINFITQVIICHLNTWLRYSNDREDRYIIATGCQAPLWGQRKIHGFGWTKLFLHSLTFCVLGAWCHETKRGGDGVAVLLFPLDDLWNLVLSWGIKLNWPTKKFCKTACVVWGKFNLEGAIIFCSCHSQFFHTFTLHWNLNTWKQWDKNIYVCYILSW